MCTMISARTPISGSAKGAAGWFSLDRLYVGYDHPTHAPLEHALTLDFVNEAAGPNARVAVELPRAAARELAHSILRTLEESEGHA